jgi:hypothetical protein
MFCNCLEIVKAELLRFLSVKGIGTTCNVLSVISGASFKRLNGKQVSTSSSAFPESEKKASTAEAVDCPLNAMEKIAFHRRYSKFKRGSESFGLLVQTYNVIEMIF